MSSDFKIPFIFYDACGKINDNFIQEEQKDIINLMVIINFIYIPTNVNGANSEINLTTNLVARLLSLKLN